MGLSTTEKTVSYADQGEQQSNHKMSIGFEATYKITMKTPEGHAKRVEIAVSGSAEQKRSEGTKRAAPQSSKSKPRRRGSSTCANRTSTVI
jgi:hypothetical protein